MKPPPTAATITRIDPPGSRLTRAGKILAIGDRVTASDALTLATPGGVGGCVGMSAQIGVRIATVRLLSVEAPALPVVAAIESAPVTPRADLFGLGSGGPIAVKVDV